ncbi:SdpI family protein [Rubripirellula tenax]|nr:SdpI family protein [Rubripirellula tenax]
MDTGRKQRKDSRSTRSREPRRFDADELGPIQFQPAKKSKSVSESDDLVLDSPAVKKRVETPVELADEAPIDVSPSANEDAPVSDSPAFELDAAKHSSKVTSQMAAERHRPSRSGEVTAESRTYPMLDLIRKLYRICAYLWMAGSVIIALAVLGLAIPNGGQALLVAGMTAISVILSGAVVGTTLMAASEVIKLLLDVQENTHRAANMHS